MRYPVSSSLYIIKLKGIGWVLRCFLFFRFYSEINVPALNLQLCLWQPERRAPFRRHRVSRVCRAQGCAYASACHTPFWHRILQGPRTVTHDHTWPPQHSHTRAHTPTHTHTQAHSGLDDASSFTNLHTQHI